MEDNQNSIIVRFQCVSCRKFLAKFTAEDIDLFMIPCSNCKHLNLIHINNGDIYTRAYKNGEINEPDGMIDRKEVNDIIYKLKAEKPMHLA